MFKFSRKVILGTIAGTLLLTGSAFAWTAKTKSIQARFAQIQLIVDGKKIQTKAEPFIYNGNVYAPIATIANGIGVHQEWDNKTPAVRVSSPKGGSIGPTIKEKNDAILKNQDSRGQYTKYAPLFNDLYFGVSDLVSNGMTFIQNFATNKTLNIPVTKISGYTTNATHVAGYHQSLISLNGNANDGVFMMNENLWKSDDSLNYISFFKIQNDVITKVNSQRIEHDKNTFIKVTCQDNQVYVNFFKNDSNNEGNLVKVRVYDIKNYNLVLNQEITK
ncbi:stalk domain-containing protein [Ammoniphilus sp. 3BR4]|uniref:stalk domain-containing protein n=1 Tax=Ammoniphilus sp. 3BR4 TaxID=3158265 RepID=UPI0034678DC3